MKVIKRDGHMVDYCPEKIEQAILKAKSVVLLLLTSSLV